MADEYVHTISAVFPKKSPPSIVRTNSVFSLVADGRHGRPSDDAHESQLSGRRSPRLQDGHERRPAGGSPAARQPAGHEGAAQRPDDALRRRPGQHGDGHEAAAGHGGRTHERTDERGPDGPPPDDLWEHDVQRAAAATAASPAAAASHAPAAAPAAGAAPAAATVHERRPNVPAAHGQHAAAETQHPVPRTPAGTHGREPHGARGTVPHEPGAAGQHAAHGRAGAGPERHGRGHDRRGGPDLAGHGAGLGSGAGTAGTVSGPERV